MSHPRQNERVAYHNGQILPESEVLISFRDRGFLFGDAVVRHRPHLRPQALPAEGACRPALPLAALPAHRSAAEPAETVGDISEDVLARNLHLLDKQDDYWVSQRVSRGPLNTVDRDAEPWAMPTVIVECQPLPLKARATLFRDGVEVVVPPVRRAAPDVLSPRAKTP